MNRYVKGGAAVTDISERPGAGGRGKSRPHIVRGNDRRRGESAVIDDDMTVLDRENSAAAREDAAQLREDAAHLREGKATSREGKATSREDAAHLREGAATSREDAAHLREGKATSREGKATSREDAAHLREGAATSREDAAHLREGKATSREDAAHLREGAATSREHEIRTAETKQAASDIHMTMLQQANALLVISTLEAQQLTEQVMKARTELERAKQAAEKANRAKSDFLSSMSHELRSPLNAILGFAQLMECSTPPPTDVQAARLQQITKAGWYLLELINEILDLAVIESGKIPLTRVPVSLADVMNECKTIIEPQAQRQGIRINYPPIDPAWVVDADRIRVKQILINLLSNAVKYNREHGTVEVTCTAGTPGRIRIGIKDSGIGLPPEVLANLFQPFNRLGQQYGDVEGTGIGLVVVKQLVELMGGTIGVESTAGVGSEFWIELLRSGEATRPAAAQALPVEPGMKTGTESALHTLLYVEDDPANLMLVEQIVAEHTHMRMLSAYDGHLGVELARLQRPDVILMDISLPDMSGIDALNILRKEPATAHIPVIAISANAMTDDIQKGLDAGFFRYLAKPIKVHEFMETLNDALAFAEEREAETGTLR